MFKIISLSQKFEPWGILTYQSMDESRKEILKELNVTYKKKIQAAACSILTTLFSDKEVDIYVIGSFSINEARMKEICVGKTNIHVLVSDVDLCIVTNEEFDKQEIMRKFIEISKQYRDDFFLDPNNIVSTEDLKGSGNAKMCEALRRGVHLAGEGAMEIPEPTFSQLSFDIPVLRYGTKALKEKNKPFIWIKFAFALYDAIAHSEKKYTYAYKDKKEIYPSLSISEGLKAFFVAQIEGRLEINDKLRLEHMMVDDIDKIKRCVMELFEHYKKVTDTPGRLLGETSDKELVEKLPLTPQLKKDMIKSGQLKIEGRVKNELRKQILLLEPETRVYLSLTFFSKFLKNTDQDLYGKLYKKTQRPFLKKVTKSSLDVFLSTTLDLLNTNY